MSEDTEQATNGAEQKSGRFRSWFKTKMSWAEAKDRASKDLEEAKEFDRRGLLLGRLLVALMLGCAVFGIRQEFGDVGLIFATVVAALSFWLVWGAIWLGRAVDHYWQFSSRAFAGASAGVVAVAGAFALKGYVYHQLAEMPIPETVEEARDLLPGLEPLRAAIFDLANDPLGVWEMLKMSAEVGILARQETLGSSAPPERTGTDETEQTGTS